MVLLYLEDSDIPAEDLTGVDVNPVDNEGEAVLAWFTYNIVLVSRDSQWLCVEDRETAIVCVS